MFMLLWSDSIHCSVYIVTTRLFRLFSVSALLRPYRRTLRGHAWRQERTAECTKDLHETRSKARIRYGSRWSRDKLDVLRHDTSSWYLKQKIVVFYCKLQSHTNWLIKSNSRQKHKEFYAGKNTVWRRKRRIYGHCHEANYRSTTTSFLRFLDTHTGNRIKNTLYFRFALTHFRYISTISFRSFRAAFLRLLLRIS